MGSLKPLEVEQIQAGEMANFSYLVFCPTTRRAAAVDPSLAPERLLERARQLNLHIETIINTHGHYDHIAGNDTLKAASGAPLAGHPADLPNADIPLEEGSRLAIGEGELSILHTPGHTPGSITLHPPGALISGDTLFVTRVGRADLAGSDPQALYHSLLRLASFPDETTVYPGHDYGPQPISTIGFEKNHNPFLQCKDLTSFLKLRMG